MEINKLRIIAGISLALLLCSSVYTQTFVVEGTVRDLYTKKGIPSVNITVSGSQKGATTDSNGSYRIDGLKRGIYVVAFSHIAYAKAYRKINLEKYSTLSLSVSLEEQAIQFDPIEITPGVIEMSTEEASSSTVTNQEILSSATVFSKDVYRSLQVVPGVSNSEWSSKPYIKGGNPDETAVIIDNLEIYEPFHLEEIDGPYSVISSDLVKDMKLITGGFAPKYSDKMSGILKINTIDRIDEDSIKASVDFSSAGVSVNQRINDKTNVFFSGRRSYIFLLEKASNSNFPTVVYDLWSKVDYKLDAANRLTLNFMLLNDNIKYNKDSTFIRREFFNSSKLNYYSWVNWHRVVNTRRFYMTTAGFQSLYKNADFAFDGSFTADNVDQRSTKVVSLKHDQYWKIFPDHTLEFGAEFNQFFADYNYREFRLNPTETTDFAVTTDIVLVDQKFDGRTAAGYVQDTYAYSDRLSFMTGLRLSYQSYSADPQLAPRAAVSFEATDNLNLKLAYGWYYQPDNFFKMKAYDNQYRLNRTPEKSIHYVASAAYSPHDNIGLTADLFYKDYRRLNDDYNFDFSNRIEGVGIIDKNYNTRSGYATGFDLSMRQRYGTLNLLTVGYSFSVSRIRDDRNIETPRDLDRTHSLVINNIHNFPNSITFSSVFRIRSGDPYTPSAVQILGDSTVADSRIFYVTRRKNSGRLPLFHSLDLRLEKRWNLNHVYLVTYASVINALDHDNIRQKSWNRQIENGKLVAFTQENQLYFPRFYTLGISLEFSVPRSR